jgi:halimadienyl-diphosphate synthase
MTYAEIVSQTEISDLLSSLGPGKSYTSSTAYDTAWTAQLAKDFPQRSFDVNLTWLREHQHADGSWGGAIFHYHDRTISTLSAIIALTKHGSPKDRSRIAAGIGFLWNSLGKLRHDADDTNGFPLLVASLITEGLSLRLDIPRYISGDPEVVKKKLSMLPPDPLELRYTTLAYSLEAIIDNLPKDQHFDLTLPGFSVGTSPSATAACLLNPNTFVQQSLDYLERIVEQQRDGGTPTVDPIDTFQAAWSLNNLRVSDAISPNDPQVKRLLDFLYEVWDPEYGLTYSSDYGVTDLDDTAEAFIVLRWGGYDVSASVFAPYEEEDGFRCFKGEANRSLSANIRLLGALRWHDDHPEFERWSFKIASMLQHHDRNGYYWFDKWHISPYYPTTYAIPSLHQLGDRMLPRRIHWILKTQNEDGGWGYYGPSTPEETAYCLQALVYAHVHIEPVDSAALQAAAHFLENSSADDEPLSLWIGKGLYTPYKVVQSAILMALHSYYRYYA